MSERRNLIVTGISSFIGTHLAIAFRKAGWNVSGTVSSEAGSYAEIRKERLDAATEAGVSIDVLDVRDPEGVRRLIDEVAPDLVIHHAGWATNYGSPEYDLSEGHRTNVAPLDSIYESLSGTTCEGLIVTGSSGEYSDHDQLDDEADSCEPSTPYGLSKLTETLRARQLAHQHGVRTRVARIYIPFGPMDSPKKLIPTVLSSIAQGQPVQLSACQQARDFAYIDDIVSGYHALYDDLKRDSIFDIFNLCSGQPTVLKDFLISLCELVGQDSALLEFGARPMRAGEPEISAGSAAKAERILNWQAEDLQPALAAYISDMP